jgi:hypothetical protein
MFKTVLIEVDVASTLACRSLPLGSTVHDMRMYMHTHHLLVHK